MKIIKNIILIYITVLYTINVYSQKSNYNKFLSEFSIATYSSLTGNDWDSFYQRNSSLWITADTTNYKIYNKKNGNDILHCIEKTNNKDEEIFIFSNIRNTEIKSDSIVFSMNVLIPDKNNILDIYISNESFSHHSSFKTNNKWQNCIIGIPNNYTDGNTSIKVCVAAKLFNNTDKIYLKNIDLHENNIKDTDNRISQENINDHEFDTSSRISFPADNINDEHVKRLETLCLVWGFMKYYHPDIRSGKRDWNYDLLRMLPTVFNANSYKDFCRELDNSIPLNSININNNYKNKDSIISQIRKGWINPRKLGKRLYKRILPMNTYGCMDNHIYCVGFLQGDNEEMNEKIVYFPNETSYNNISVEDAGYRILALFRFWNMMYYFHPYMYQKEKQWIKALPDYIRMFAKADNKKDFDIACTLIANALKDTHTEIYGQETNVAGTQIWNTHYLPFDFKLIHDNRLLVMKPLTKEAEKCSLKKGDYILRVNGKRIKDIRNEKLKYSNFGKTSLDQYDDAYASFTGDNVTYTIKRGGKKMNVTINDFRKYWGTFTTERIDTIKTIDNDILYINLAKITFDRLKDVLPTAKNKKGIIFDMRGYPDRWNDTRRVIADFLYPQQQTVWNYAYADLQNPGTFRINKHKGIFGKGNSDYYKGKTVVIVDGMTMSAAEHIAAIICKSPNGMSVGEPTGGVLGRVSYAPFISGRAMRFTGTGIYLPSGECTYPDGIHIDKEVYPSPMDIGNNIDGKIRTAVNIIKNE